VPHCTVLTAHNATQYLGFEEIGPNSFVNAALQLLTFVRPLRARLQRHLCAHPACLACELRFVMDIACQAMVLPPPARSATAQNFIRALNFVPEAKRLGVMHPCTLDAPRRMDLFLRLLLERVGKELANNADIPPGSGSYSDPNAAAAAATSAAAPRQTRRSGAADHPA
jgi:hypothetical protein